MLKRTVIVFVALFALLTGVSAQLIAPGPGVKSSVQPLLKTTWGQNAPYNQYCPQKKNSSGELQNCPVGCVALALGQIMKYHNYPEIGQGYKSYQPFGLSEEISADFENTQYKWNLMKDSYVRLGSTALYTDEEADAVATLLFHAGVSVGTIYAISGSSAFAYGNIPRDMVENFRYSEDKIRYLSRSDYTKEEWMNLIFKELSNGRPIFYAGNSPEAGGHAFVLDGYNTSGKVHINWGWRGTDNGYYDIDLLTGENNYSENQSMVIGIMPPSDGNTDEEEDTDTETEPEEDTETSIITWGDKREIVNIYNANGAQIRQLQRGMNIVVYNDGTIKKVFLK